jgi:hypothetical protein
VLKVTESNWGEPVMFPIISTYADKTYKRVAAKSKNLNVVKSVPDVIFSIREQMRGCMRIRRNAEIGYVKDQEVGDGHSSEDGMDRTTLSEQRAISLNMQLMKHKCQGRMQ